MIGKCHRVDLRQSPSKIKLPTLLLDAQLADVVLVLLILGWINVTGTQGDRKSSIAKTEMLYFAKVSCL